MNTAPETPISLPAVRPRRRAVVRTLVRCAFFLTAAACVFPLLPWREAALALPALSPYIALCGLATRHAIGDLLLGLALPATALVMLRKRWLCRYVCPVGLLNDQAARLRPRARGRFARWPHLGRWAALLTLGGSLVGYPLFLWLDPFSIFNGALGAFAHRPVTVLSALPAAVLAAIVLLSALWPGAWCQRLCPLGATQELLALPRQWLLRLRRPAAPKPAAPGPGGMPLARRSALALALGGAWAWAGRKLPVHAEDAPPPPILPPGAAPRGQFHGLCVRCGNCVRVCPTKIIEPDLGAGGLAGVAGFMAPRLSFEFDYCHPDCHECTKVCPSGAIARLSLAQKHRAVIGLARINHETCLAAQGGECNACTMACLYDAIGGGGEPSPGNLSAAPVISAKRCVGCGACELVCPVPGKAVTVAAAPR